MTKFVLMEIDVFLAKIALGFADAEKGNFSTDRVRGTARFRGLAEGLRIIDIVFAVESNATLHQLLYSVHA